MFGRVSYRVFEGASAQPRAATAFAPAAHDAAGLGDELPEAALASDDTRAAEADAKRRAAGGMSRDHIARCGALVRSKRHAVVCERSARTAWGVSSRDVAALLAGEKEDSDSGPGTRVMVVN